MKSNENPYKKNYCTQTYSKSINKNTKLNKKDIIKLNKELRDIEKEQNNIYNKKSKLKKQKPIFKCDKCDISYNNPASL